MDFEGYCVKCRKKQKITNGTIGKTAKGKPMAKGTCPECGTKVNRFLSERMQVSEFRKEKSTIDFQN